MKQPSPTSARDLIEAIGTERVQALVGRGYKSVNRAANTGKMTSAWFGPLSAECERIGIDCPKELFNWAADIPSPSSPPANREAAE